MSTATEVPPNLRYPLRFEVTDGPSFQRIADAAKYYHDPYVRMQLRFTGILTDTLTGRKRKVVLRADCYGFWSGIDYNWGEMSVFLDFKGYWTRFGSTFHYSWRDRKILETIEMARKQ